MSSTASPTPEAPSGDDLPFRSGFTPELQGQRAECDGGRPIEGTKYAGRQEFTGTLTGAYRDFGPYPWRWYLLAQLTRKPPGFAYEAVWCDADSLTLIDENGRPLDVTLD
ncbi:conserved protein of unknown function [Denitratisoma oestradiolicum]|uniref:Uncharacterized protein n=2 Tax=Denitratisoma oestradiolicum TaxID=311182 RepID=A0A6S6XWM8_9PROT|nr:hypothetical protein [Denitratisoma oestradiolicum]CAB1369250.1 conserved protein of unknown function [Denitratisoma oestradiolicum]CAB1369279.1 conserved protein of unknown function [Denitratisoma oestradiolicum]